jgi:hypothetical protein
MKQTCSCCYCFPPSPNQVKKYDYQEKTRKEVEPFLSRSRDPCSLPYLSRAGESILPTLIRHLQSTSLLFIEARDLQVPIIASKVDGLTSAIQSLAPCTDLHLFFSFFTDLTCSSRSTLQPDALHQLLKYPMDADLQPDVSQSTRSYRLAARCIIKYPIMSACSLMYHKVPDHVGLQPDVSHRLSSQIP